LVVLWYVFLICAIGGGTLFMGQFALSLLGLGHHDVDMSGVDTHVEGHAGGGHGESSWLFSLVSIRAILSAITVFGLSGLAAKSAGWGNLGCLVIALGVGLVTMTVVGLLVHSMSKLGAEGTVHVDNAVGEIGTVYLTIPAQRQGSGKVTIIIQSRTMEYRAVTAGAELPTGTRVVVQKVSGPNTVEVAAAE